MEDDDVRSRLETVEQELRVLRARLDRLDTAAGTAVESLAAPAIAEAPGRPPSGPGAGAPAAPLGVGALALAGRVLLVLAGAYLIRTLSDARALSLEGGAALGLAYALAWTLLAHRNAAAGHRAAATVHGLTTGLIAYPLLWETATRFRVLPPPLALLLTTGVFAAALLLSSRHALAVVAWGSTGLAVGSTLALLAATHDLGMSVLALLGQAAVVESLAHARSWQGPRYLTAIGANAGTLVLIWLAGRPQGLPEGYPPLAPGAAVTLALALPALYLVSVAARTLRAGLSATGFDVAQFAVAVAIGFRGAERILAAQGTSTALLGGAAMVLGLLGYGVAFTFVERRRGHDVNFYFYSTAGGLLTFFGTMELLGAGGRSVVCAAVALTAAWLGERFGRTTLRSHAAAFLMAAGVVSGLLRVAWDGLFGTPRVPDPAALAVCAAAVAAYGVLAGGATRSAWSAASRAVVGLVGVWSLTGLGGGTLAVSLGLSPAVLAAVRTGVLASSAVALAAASRRWRLIELPGLAYAVLVAGAVKLVVQDWPLGRPGELAVALLLYGSALLLAPRLCSRG
jgi:hypothetical protein